MKRAKLPAEPVGPVILEKLVNGGQALGRLPDGKKVFVWGALPGETVMVRLARSKRDWAEGAAATVVQPSPERIAPRDGEGYLSTSPWQILDESAELHWKQQLIRDAFAQQGITLEDERFTNGDSWYGYRNKVEFSWYGQTDDAGREQLDLAFFRRGSKGKLPVEGTSLARESINQAARQIRDLLRAKGVTARALKTLLIRCNQQDAVTAQLYVKDDDFAAITETDAKDLGLHGFSVIFSNPKSPASVITKVLGHWGSEYLEDSLLGTTFRYATEGFFQVNLPVYEQALLAMRQWILPDTPVLDMYSGVGSIGLTIGGSAPTMVELNRACVLEMERNVQASSKTAATIVHAASEDALDHITAGQTVIVDPPRAGLHADVTARLLDQRPPSIIYLSCNPSTQARDVALLQAGYRIETSHGFNFFPRTPHIESLIVLSTLA
ncbi:class I SAM-dependent RNA methyltransferase [Candidatus Saccharibacteria bacterium]|nr:class I SAM-dependent RNA methyltransferase [Candidatus Saccharibacteria bacterium]